MDPLELTDPEILRAQNGPGPARRRRSGGAFFRRWMEAVAAERAVPARAERPPSESADSTA